MPGKQMTLDDALAVPADWTNERAESGWRCSRYGTPEGPLYIEVVAYPGDDRVRLSAFWRVPVPGLPRYTRTCGCERRHKTFSEALAAGADIVRQHAEGLLETAPLNEHAYCRRCQCVRPIAVWGAFMGHGGQRLCTRCLSDVDEEASHAG